MKQEICHKCGGIIPSFIMGSPRSFLESSGGVYDCKNHTKEVKKQIKIKGGKRKKVIPTKIKYWVVVDYVNPEANPDRGYLRPKLYEIYGSETREDNEHFCFDTKKRDFILSYTTKLLFVNQGKLSEEELKDMLSKKLKEFKENESVKN